MNNYICPTEIRKCLAGDCEPCQRERERYLAKSYKNLVKKFGSVSKIDEILAMKDAYEHPDGIRCPHCEKLRDACYYDRSSLYEEGGMFISCYDCGKDFVVSVDVRYFYKSMATSGEKK